MSGYSLEPGSRSADQSDRSAPDAVGKSQANPVDDRCATVRSQHEQAFVAGGPLQCNFIFERDIVTIEKNVLVEIQGIAGHSSRISTGNRDQRPARLG